MRFSERGERMGEGRRQEAFEGQGKMHIFFF